jgi:type II secretory pathway pseudopilin PulG
MHGKLKIVNFKSRIENRSAGFTLTEVIIASALLIVAIVPILKGLTSAHLTSTIIEHRTHSLTLAQAKLDDIRARSIYNWGVPGSFVEQDTSLDGAYLCDVQASGGDPRTITVSVGYDVNGDGILAPEEVEVTLSTLVARRW